SPTMTAVAGPFLIVCTILGLGGVAKIVAPISARRAIRAAGIPVPVVAVRSLGVAEVALACAAALKGGRILPSAVGVAYVAFALFVVLMLRRSEGTSCGCFGNADTPASWLHVVVNVASAGIAFGAIGIGTLGDVLSAQPWAGIPLLGLVALGTYLVFLMLTALPVVLAPPQARVAEFSLAGAPTS
ncbi:MAG: MauE/DoxX family redox-associated membrane protein, partial [Acidimicrobiales bacterium]